MCVSLCVFVSVCVCEGRVQWVGGAVGSSGVVMVFAVVGGQRVCVSIEGVGAKDVVTGGFRSCISARSYPRLQTAWALALKVAAEPSPRTL